MCDLLFMRIEMMPHKFKVGDYRVIFVALNINMIIGNRVKICSLSIRIILYKS